ncbi:hypothetical protein [Paenibacillus planticolens]|uniref:DUF4179 domain-containing protein n=1 Tax=Paenibacillus planticolens TaxID=2654976 RepID=A0ABX1ZFE8_9BACL|nr:hypothetical protein [Paenibacillus planticolens]NOU98805.1 hypothetical protein [Paenibacillus planticolens]
MAQNEDKPIFAWMDRLDPKELQGMEEIDPSAEERVEEAAWQRIKSRTFARLDIGEESLEPLKKVVPYEKASRRKWLPAACAAVILSTAFISFSPGVRAELKKALQFIPGFGFVQQSEAPEETAYVLPKPVGLTGENGEITLEGVLIQGSGGQISLSGNKVSAVAVKSIILETEQGQFEFKQSNASWGGSGPWQAGYYFDGKIPYEGLEDATLRFDNTIIGQLHLTKAKTADDLAGFGSSDIQNGIRITSIVTPLDGSSRKVNLLAQLPGRQTVDSYGKEPIAEGLQLQLTDDEGQSVPIKKDTGFVKPRELLFDNPNGANHYQLAIPAIRIVDPGAGHVKVTLPVPEEGTKEIHVTSQLAGFPVDFTRVERVNADSVRFEVDTHFDTNLQRTLQNYRLFTKDGVGLSYSTKLNEKTWAVESEWLDVKPGQKEITFYIGEPQIVVKGPWILSDLR